MLLAVGLKFLWATGSDMTDDHNTPLACTIPMLTTAFLLAAGCAGPTAGTGTDTGTDTVTDTGTDTVTDTGTDTVTDTGPDTVTDTGTDTVTDTITTPPIDPDLNGDGTLNILVIGTNQSIQDGGEAFSPDQIAAELQSILSADATLSVDVNVVAEDMYRTKQLVTGYGQSGDEYNWFYYCHSFAQYYFWPEGRDARMANLAGQGAVDWDQVVIGGDPNIVSETPGYYSLGVNKVATKVAEGDAQPLLLMLWPKNENGASIDHFAEFTYRTGDGAKVQLPIVPAGRAWGDLPAGKKDSAGIHPTPNGAYVAAATIYAHMVGKSASSSEYLYDDELADAALSTVLNEAGKVHYTGHRSFVSPFKSSDITDRVLNYNHTGSSSENGILGGLKWVLAKAQVKLESGGEPPINFNYGRANTEFEAHKRYKIDPGKFEFSLGFPMQDHSNYGNTTMLYGLDKRRHGTENGTDLGVARKMVRDSELPYGRSIPVRTLLVLMKEAIPEQSAYSDGWHMNGDLNKAIGAYMYTLLTGHCALDAEPADKDSKQWRSWLAHKTGYETAWNLMHLSAAAPCFKVTPDSPDSTSVTTTEGAGLSISFTNPPTGNVTVSLSTNNDTAVSYEPTEMVFTPENYNLPQKVSMLGLDGELPVELYTITAGTESTDPTFDGLVDRWEYTVIR
jgi:hypothetical protein